jgi:tetratricopeptide (TPR) repeat protein
VTPPTSAVNRWHVPLALASIWLLTLLVYLPAMHGGMVWDDDDNITRPELQSMDGLFRIWSDPAATAQYYPMVHTVFWLEHKLWGDEYLEYHLVNVLWHSLAVTLVYSILARLKIPGAFLAVAIFAVHPVMVESVAWMTEQKNTLSAVLYLSAMLMYLRFDESRKRTYYGVALGCFVLALLTKTVVVTLPVAMLIVFWWQQGTLSWRRDVLPLAPFFALSVTSGLMTVWVEQTYYRGETGAFGLSYLQRFLLAGRDIWFYLSKLAWPANLSFTYVRWTIDPTQWWQWTFSIAALATTYALWLIRNYRRAPLAGWLFFCSTLFPVLGFVYVYMFTYTYVADHLQYLASLGIITMAAAGITLVLAQLSLPMRRAGAALCILYVGTLAILSARQAPMYADIVTLYRETIELNPDSWMAHNNLGVKLAEMGNQPDAITHYQSAIRIKPDYAEAHNNLGKALIRTGHLPEGIAEIQAALAIRPDFFEALNNLGVALTNAGQDSEAVHALQSALALAPDHAVTLNTLGLALIHLRRYPEAIEHTEHALRLNPDYADAHNTLGMALASTGNASQAIEQFQSALRLKPDFVEAYASLAQTYAAANQSDKAIAAAREGSKVARAAGNQSAATHVEEWLRQFENKTDGGHRGQSSETR